MNDPVADGTDIASRAGIDDEWLEWYSLTPQERWRHTTMLWDLFFRLGGSLDPEPDTQSPFHSMNWRRTTIISEDGDEFDLLSIEDLVRSKKTQRDKYWPMIRRLVEANYLESSDTPTPARVHFWLRQLRTPELLIEATANTGARCAPSWSRSGEASGSAAYSL